MLKTISSSQAAHNNNNNNDDDDDDVEDGEGGGGGQGRGSSSNKKKMGAQFICTTFRPEMVLVADRCYGVAYQNKTSSIDVVSREEALQFVEEAQVAALQGVTGPEV